MFCSIHAAKVFELFVSHELLELWESSESLDSLIESFDTSETFRSLISLESPKSLLLSLWTLVLLSLCPDVLISKQESEFFEITVSHESLELVLLWVKYGRDDISVGMAINVVDEGVTNGRAEGVAMRLAKGEAIDISVAEGVSMGLAEGVPMGATEGFTMGPAEDVAIDISVAVAEGVALAEGVNMDTFVRNSFLKKVLDLR
jgi:hypothetical protein